MATAMVDLREHVSMGECYCLNEQKNAPLANLFQGDERLMLKSDADEQLIIHIAFNTPVKIHSLSFVGPEGSESAPRVVKLFINRENLGFSDAGDIEPVQTLELSDEDLKPEVTCELKFVKFQRVQSLTIFIEENNGDDETHLSSLKFYGILQAVFIYERVEM